MKRAGRMTSTLRTNQTRLNRRTAHDETYWSNEFDPTTNQTRLNRRTAHDEMRWSNEFDPANKLNQTWLKIIIVGPNLFGQADFSTPGNEHPAFFLTVDIHLYATRCVAFLALHATVSGCV